MRVASRSWWTALVVPLVAAQAQAYTLSLGGSVGGGFEHTEIASSTQARGIPGWDFAASLSLGWAPIRSDLLSIGGTGEYGASRWLDSAAARSDRWTYHGTAAILSALPLSVYVDAGRGWSSAGDRFGTLGETLITNETVAARLAVRGYPRLTAAFTRADVETEVIGSEPRRSGSRRLTVGTSHSTPALAYSVDYGGSWSESASAAEGNYRLHGVNVSSSAKLSDHADLRYSQAYTLREPTVRDSRNPRLDQNLIGTGIALRPGERTNVSLDYSYQHALVEAQAFSVESLGHGASVGGTRKWSEAWSSDTTLQFTHGEVRNGDASRASDGQALGAGASWTAHPTAAIRTVLATRGHVGAVQRSATSEAAYGYEGSASIGWDAARGGASLAYGGGYHSNDATLDGREWSHRVALDARLARGERRLSLSLQGSASKRTDALVGTASSRTLILTAQGSSRRTSATLNAGLARGATARYGYDISPGLYVLPYELDSTSMNLALALSRRVRRVDVALQLSTARLELTGEPQEYRHGAELTATYHLGRFRLNVSDRFVASGRGAAWHRGNVFILRLVRSFHLGT